MFLHPAARSVHVKSAVNSSICSDEGFTLVLTHKHNGTHSRKMIMLSKLNVVCKRETRRTEAYGLYGLCTHENARRAHRVFSRYSGAGSVESHVRNAAVPQKSPLSQLDTSTVVCLLHPTSNVSEHVQPRRRAARRDAVIWQDLRYYAL